MAQFQFVMTSGPTPGKAFLLEEAEVTVGRDNSNAVAINDAEISRKHAKLELRGMTYVIQDLGSTNGTFINGARISGIQVLNPGDAVSFGENIALTYELVADPNATMLSSAKTPKTAAALQKPAPVRPAPSQAPTPVPSPAPGYSGQVPVGPAPLKPSKKSGSSKIVLIVIAVVILCIILGCAALLLWVDADKSGARWCQYLPFIARMLGGVCQ